MSGRSTAAEPEVEPDALSSTARQIQDFAERVRAESMRKHNEYGGAYIEVNGQVLLDYYTCPWSRLFLVVIDRDGQPSPAEEFILVDKRNNGKHVQRIVQIIEQMGDGDYLVMAVHDSINQTFNEAGQTSIPGELQEALGRVGVATPLAELDPQTPYIAIGMKGAAVGEAIEVVGRGEGVESGAGTVRYPDVPYEQRIAGAPSWTVLVIDDFTGEPIVGAKVVVQQTREFFEFTSDDRGQVRFHWVGWSPKVLGVTAEAPGKAKMERRWRDVFTSEIVPWSFDIALPQGATLGGRVVDAAGDPVPGAFLFLRLEDGEVTNGIQYPYVNDYEPIHADEDGRWSVEQAPAAWTFGQVSFSRPGWGVERTRQEITPELHRSMLAGEAVLQTAEDPD